MGSGVASIFKAGESGKASPVNTAGALLYGRVYNVLLSDKEDEYTKAGVVPGSIGAIQFKFIVKGLEDLNPTTQIAYPFDPRTRAFPVKNEVVEIVSGPSNDIKDAETNNLQVYYYKSVVDMWNSPEHNARPNSQFNQKKEQVTGEFVEKGNVGRLMHLPGDYVLEGRSGNGIRVGSSNNKSKAKSPWTGPDSSPLIVISNGRKSSKLSFEDINKDGSSMYILSDQSITFNPASLNFESYDANMAPVQAAQVVTPEPAKVEAPLAVVPPVEPPVEKPADVPTKKEELIKDEVESLPDEEIAEESEFQEYEDEGPPHVFDDDDRWRESLLTAPVTVSEVLNTSGVGGFSDLFLLYMTHQQGEGGIKAIINSAVKGLTSVPVNNGYTKAPVQSLHMPKNIGKDFGNIPLTPANFLAYWKVKVDKLNKEALSKPVPANVLTAITVNASKWGIPTDFARTICYIETRYNVNAIAKNKKYKGLFQISEALFRERYPNDNSSEIFNPNKNADVGIAYAKKSLARLTSIKKAAQP